MPVADLRLKLAAAVAAAALVPLLVLGGLGLTLAERAVEAGALERHRAAAEGFARGLAALTGRRSEELRRLAEDPRVQALQADRTAEALRDHLAQAQDFASLLAHDASGAPVAAAGARPAATSPTDVALGRLARAAAASAPTTAPLLETLPGEELGTRVVVLAVPVTALGHPERVVGGLAGAAEVDELELATLLTLFPTGVDGWACILDARGAVLARAGTGLAPGAARIELPDAWSATARSGLVAAGPCFHQGREDVVSLSFLPELDSFLAAGRPARDLRGLTGALRRNLGAAALLAVALALGLGFWLAGRVAGPVRELAIGLQQLAEGVYTVRVDEAGDLGPAARALNALAETLQRRRIVGSLWERFRGGGR